MSKTFDKALNSSPVLIDLLFGFLNGYIFDFAETRPNLPSVNFTYFLKMLSEYLLLPLEDEI